MRIRKQAQYATILPDIRITAKAAISTLPKKSFRLRLFRKSRRECTIGALGVNELGSRCEAPDLTRGNSPVSGMSTPFLRGESS